MTHASASEDETRHIAADLVGRLANDATVLLEGELGSGKTCFVRGAAAALGIDESDVASPTFALVHEYVLRGLRSVAMYHLDLYRLEGAADEELEEIGVREILAQPVVKMIEWPRPPVPGWARAPVTVRFRRGATAGERLIDIEMDVAPSTETRT